MFGSRTLSVGILVPVVLASLLTVTTGVAAAAPPANTTTYAASDATITNPERGFYHHKDDCDKRDFDPETLEDYRTNENISLVMCMFYLAEFKNGPISAAQLARLNRQADAVLAAGLKMVVRFAYTQSQSGDDAPLSRVTAHLEQLRGFFSRNRAVIAVVQSGFVGAWGEGYYSQNFGDRGNISAAQWADRKAVVDKLLDVVPPGRMVQMRTPKFKRAPLMYGPAPATADNAYTNVPVARIGHHNDCFLASDDDWGTFQDVATEYPYLAADTRYVAMGGETCNVNRPRSQCATALHEMRLFHYSYLNRDHKTDVINDWIAGRCKDDADRQLGYRFTLVSATTAPSVRRGTGMAMTLTVRNDGWAAPFNHRPVKLILRSKSTGAVYKFDVNTDPRRWLAGTTVTIDQPVIIGLIPPGTYDLLLSLPDEAGIASRPEYAIQTANTGLWDPDTGFNNLLRTVVVEG